MDYGLVSVIMPTYNCGRFIKESINSVLAQTYSNWELIIVDDCSTDNTASIITSLVDSRIRYYRNECNRGAAVSRNRALREAHGQWIAFLDSDDLWKPEKLEKQLTFMNGHNYAFTYHQYEEIDENGEPLHRNISGPKHITQYGMYAYCWPGCLTIIYRRDIFPHLQIPDIHKNNDYAMWLKLIKFSDCYLLKETLAQYRHHSGSISNQRYITLVKWHYRLFRCLKKNSMTSVLLTLNNLICGIFKKLYYVK